MITLPTHSKIALRSGVDYNIEWVDLTREIRRVESVISNLGYWSRWREIDVSKGMENGGLTKEFSREAMNLFFTTEFPAFYRWLSFNDETALQSLKAIEKDAFDILFECVHRIRTGTPDSVLAKLKELGPVATAATKEMNRTLGTIAPAKFSYKGFKVKNAYRMSEKLVSHCMDAISAMLAVFKRRSMEKVLMSSVREIILIPVMDQATVSGGGVHGRYDSGSKTITISGIALRTISAGRFLKEWVHEVFLHEFGHHVHLSEMTSEARSFWNEGWAEVWRAEFAGESTEGSAFNSVDSKQFLAVRKEDVQSYWNALKASKFKPKTAVRKLSSPVDQEKFRIWLSRAGIFGESGRETARGKQDLHFLSQYPNHKSEWVEAELEDKYGDWRSYVLERLRVVKSFPSNRDIEEAEKKLRNTHANQYVDVYEEILLRLGLDPSSNPPKPRSTPVNLYLSGDESKRLQELDPEYQKSQQEAERRKQNVERRKDDLGIPSDYGRTDVKEDFAETFVLWMTNPRKLHPVAQWRMGRALWLSGYGGKPIMRLGMARRVAELYLQAGSCPVRSKLYGGIPDGGGYATHSELEVGAQRIAEAAHCVLGSLGRNLGAEGQDWGRMLKFELGHIEEETDLIAGLVKEYAKPLYLKRLVGAYIAGETSAQKSVVSILKASKSLHATASKAREALSKYRGEMPDDVYRTALITYGLLVDLSKAMNNSMSELYLGTGAVVHPFEDAEVQRRVIRLKASVRSLASGV